MTSQALSPEEFQSALRRLLVLVTAADEEIDPAEVQMLIKVYRALTGEEFGESDILDELSELAARPVALDGFVRPLAPRLDWDRKQQMLKAVLLVSSADGAVQDEERDAVQTVASALAQDPDELERLVRATRFRA